MLFNNIFSYIICINYLTLFSSGTYQRKLCTTLIWNRNASATFVSPKESRVISSLIAFSRKRSSSYQADGWRMWHHREFTIIHNHHWIGWVVGGSSVRQFISSVIPLWSQLCGGIIYSCTVTTDDPRKVDNAVLVGKKKVSTEQ